MRVHVEAAGLITCPDFGVSCGGPHFSAQEKDALTHPALIIEVISPTSEAYDRGDKFAHYQHIESPQAYVLISQDKPRLERYARRDGGTWAYELVDGLDAVTDLEPLDADVSLAHLYTGIDLPPAGRTAGGSDAPPA